MIELKIERTKSTCYKIRFVGRKLSGISYDSKTYDVFILLSEKGFKQEALNSWILFCKFRFNLKFNFVQNFRCFRSLDGDEYRNSHPELSQKCMIGKAYRGRS